MALSDLGMETKTYKRVVDRENRSHDIIDSEQYSEKKQEESKIGDRKWLWMPLINWLRRWEIQNRQMTIRRLRVEIGA